jgi:hypothetical protein
MLTVLLLRRTCRKRAAQLLPSNDRLVFWDRSSRWHLMLMMLLSAVAACSFQCKHPFPALLFAVLQSLCNFVWPGVVLLQFAQARAQLLEEAV